MATIESTASSNWGASVDLVLEILKEEHEKQLALAHQLTRELAPPDEGDVDDMQPTTEYRLAQMLEERLSKTWLEEAVSNVLRDASCTVDQSPAAPAAKDPVARDREHHARSAMSYLLMALMEMHTRSGTSDQAYDLADKALAAIGPLRVMTGGGRIRA